MVMRMEEGLDTGPMLMAERVRIGRKTTGELHDELAQLRRRSDGAGAVRTRTRQPSKSMRKKSEACHLCRRRSLKEEAHIDWTRPAGMNSDCLVRGLSPAAGRMVRNARGGNG